MEEWFEARMRVLSVAYRRHVRYVLVAIGLFVAIAMNVDALGVTNSSIVTKRFAQPLPNKPYVRTLT